MPIVLTQPTVASRQKWTSASDPLRISYLVGVIPVRHPFIPMRSGTSSLVAAPEIEVHDADQHDTSKRRS